MEGAIENPDLTNYKFSLAVIQKWFWVKKGRDSDRSWGKMSVLVLKDWINPRHPAVRLASERIEIRIRVFRNTKQL